MHNTNPGANMSNSNEMIWSYLVHLSYNMWSDRPMDRPHLDAKDELRFDEELWSDMLTRMQDSGVNMVIIDVGDAVLFESHPEISVRGAWTRDKLGEELERMRAMGIEPIPKMNFSTAHDAWLGPYARMVSTEVYYTVCRDLVTETCKLFDMPRFFHLGYDEETAGHQRNYLYAVMRQHELWWHDFNFFIDTVEAQGVRPWIWSDYAWNHPEEFWEKMPKSVFQSNWYYGEKFDVNDMDEREQVYVKTYDLLEEHGYDQVPTGSNWSNNVNFQRTVDYSRDHIPSERLKGFMHAPWHPTLADKRDAHLSAIDEIAHARKTW
jgi:hypothetical protein